MGDRLGLEPTVRFDPNVEELRALIARRDQLVAQRAAEKRRLPQASLGAVRRSHESAIAGLDGEIASFDRLIAKAASTPRLAERARLLTSLPGIGAATAAVLVAHLPELGSLDPKRIASLAGLAPHPRASGNSSRPRFVHGGRSRLRRAFYMIALTASRMDGPFRQFHQRLVSHGKPKKLALIALARKIVTVANAIIRDGKAYAGTHLPRSEWALVVPFLPPPAGTGRPREWPMRLIVDAILYALWAGGARHLLPRDFPPRGTVYRWFARLARTGTFEHLAHALTMLDRERAGREASPSAVVIDAQSVRSGGVGVARQRGGACPRARPEGRGQEGRRPQASRHGRHRPPTPVPPTPRRTRQAIVTPDDWPSVLAIPITWASTKVHDSLRSPGLPVIKCTLHRSVVHP